MARHYVTTDAGKRVLALLECDGCGATIRPYPKIAQSGWVKYGVHYGVGRGYDEWDYCPWCAAERGISA